MKQNTGEVKHNDVESDSDVNIDIDLNVDSNTNIHSNGQKTQARANNCGDGTAAESIQQTHSHLQPTIVSLEDISGDSSRKKSIQQQNTSTAGTSAENASRNSNKTNTSKKPKGGKGSGSEEDDVSSRAAVALAAVAAAATANNSSPSAAAQAARAVAQSFVLNKGDQSSHSATDTEAGSGRKICMQTLNSLPELKSQLELLVTKYSEGRNELEDEDPTLLLLEKLANGENDAFLQHLLLMGHFKIASEEDKKSLDDKIEEQPQCNQDDQASVADAAELLVSILQKAEGAYDGLLGMLPKLPKKSSPSSPDSTFSSMNGDADEDNLEIHPTIIPDLLPPCYTKGGDPTLEFFRACMGTTPDKEKNQVSKSSPAGDLDDSDRSGGTALSASTERSSRTRGGSSLAKTEQPPMPQPANTNTHGLPNFGKFASAGATGASVFTSMFSSLKMNAVNSSKGIGINNVFRKNQWNVTKGPKAPLGRTGKGKAGEEQDSSSDSGEYTVQIEPELLGLTVENVLERTVVRTVLPGGAALKAGAKVGSLIVKVGSIETKNLTHFETIDELRQSQRPLQLTLRVVGDAALRSAREEMGRLITGAGFGVVTGGFLQEPRPVPSHATNDRDNHHVSAMQIARGADKRVEDFTKIVKRRFENALETKNKKEETLERAGEKLVWILTLMVIGLEKEATRLMMIASTKEGKQQSTDERDENASASPRRHSYNHYHHTSQDYSDAAKSVSKILLDFVKKKLDPPKFKDSFTGGMENIGAYSGSHRIRKNQLMMPGGGQIANQRGARRGQPMIPGMQQSLIAKQDSTILHEKPLLQIGDVLHRTRTFLADPSSPPAALLRGEVIAFLCDVLDIDTAMELSEEDTLSGTAGGKPGQGQAGPITDLGSAGSLLKLNVLNCSFIRSPTCEASLSDSGENIHPELANELKRRFGVKKKLDKFDLHRLHAGNRFLSVVHRLAASRSTSARITACSLAPVLWGHLDFPHQLQLRGVITRALHDGEVIVRKSTATVLHEIAELVFDPRSVPWLVLMCERAMTDPEPQLRSAAMTLTWHLAEHLPNAFLGDASQGSRRLRRLPNRSDPVFADVYLLQCKLLPVATRLAEDRAPSVRIAVAAQCDRLCHALGEHWSSVIIDVLLALLADSDERVRSEAVLCVPRLSEIVFQSSAASSADTVRTNSRPASEISVLEALLPASINLQKDKSSSVRVSLATAAGELLTLLVGLQSIHEISTQQATASSNNSDRAETSSTSDGSGNSPGYPRQLKKYVDDLLIPLVQRLLHDSDPEVTSSALRAVSNASRGTVREISGTQPYVDNEDAMSVSSHQSHASSCCTSSKKEPVFLPVLSEEQVLRLLPTLSELAKSRQWRVRQSAVEIVPALLGCTHNLQRRTEISRLCIQLMGDSVDAVRQTAAECLCLGGGSLGSHGESLAAEWITSIVIPNVRICAMHSNAKQRLLSLKMIETILLNGACPTKWATKPSAGVEDSQQPVVSSVEKREGVLTESPMRELAVIALSLTNDNVPNVRLNVGRILESVIHVFEENELSFIKEVLLQQLQSEREREGGGDSDVIFFATRCIHKARMTLDPESDLELDLIEVESSEGNFVPVQI